jgi:hypothetical protein
MGGRQTFKILLRSCFRPRDGSHPKDADDSALWKAVRYVQMCRPQADFYAIHDNKKPYMEASLLPMLSMWG